MIEFNNLQDNIVYHSNIFNYDKQFLMNLLKIKIRLDFAEYFQVKNSPQKDKDPIMEFFKKPSKNSPSYISPFFLYKFPFP